MKKKLLLLILGLFSTIAIYAKKIDGIIVFKNDSIAHVTFKIPIVPFFGIGFETIQKRIKYYNSTKKIVILKPDQAKEIKFRYWRKDIRMLSFYNNKFLRLLIDDRLKYYYEYDRQRGNNQSTYYLQKGSGKLFHPSGGKRFKIEMMKYLSDCPEVVKKINIEAYGNGGLDTHHPIEFYIAEIVTDYNNSK
jgi:hypothetical protein